MRSDIVSADGFAFVPGPNAIIIAVMTESFTGETPPVQFADDRRHGERECVVPDDPPPPERRAGQPLDAARAMANLMRRTQLVLGPRREGGALEELGGELEALAQEAGTLGWEDHEEHDRVLGDQRPLRLGKIMRRRMLGRTESRSVHSRADFPKSDAGWLRKQAVRADAGADAGLALQQVPL